MKLLQTVFCIALLIGSFTNLSAQDKDRDTEIRILEDVIEVTTANPLFSKYFASPKVNGVYLDGYGVVFQLRYETRKYRGDKAIDARKRMAILKDNLNSLFQNYFGRIEPISPNDNITMVVYPSAKSFSKDWSGSTKIKEFANEEFLPQSFILTTKRSNLLRSAPKQILLDENSSFQTASTRTDLNIFAVILERALEEELDKSIGRNSVQSTLLDDYGILLTIRTGRSSFYSTTEVIVRTPTEVTPMTGSDGKKSLELAFTIPDYLIREAQKIDSSSDRITSMRETKRSIANRIVEILGSYGATVKGLDRDDNVTVHFSTQSGFQQDEENVNMQITIKYGEILDYSRGRIRIDQLKSKITYLNGNN